MGDLVLQTVAGVMRREIRGDDFVCRYGGEEFALLLRRCTPAQATDVAERIRQAVGSLSFETDAGAITVTVSGGLSALRSGWELPQQLEDADRLLYRAKREGRNRILIL